MSMKGKIMEVWRRLTGGAGQSKRGEGPALNRLDQTDMAIADLERRTSRTERVLELYRTERGTISQPPGKREDDRS